MTTTMFHDFMLMGIILNPFAQMVYLSDLINQTETGLFRKIFTKASLMTWGIFLGCAFLGEMILFPLFQVTLPAMRVFGGLVNLSLAYAYVIHGPEGIKLFRGDVTELAQRITLPVMVGAGTVWVSMKIGSTQPAWATIFIISAVLFVNALFILGYQHLLKKARGRIELMLVKYFGMAMRLNAMVIGAVGVQMILGGIEEYLKHPV